MSDDFPARLRRARERMMLDQTQFALKIGVSAKTVRNWETGKSIPRNRMGALEQYLDAPTAGPSSVEAGLREVERRVRESDLFSGEALEKAVALARDDYLARRVSDTGDASASGE